MALPMKFLIYIPLILFSLNSFGAQDVDLPFFPSFLDKASIQKMIDKLMRIYTPYAEGLNRKLEIYQNYENENFKAEAGRRNDNTWVAYITGGVAHYPGMTEDALSLSLCHELGHIFGGFPFKNFWFSTEGQADYYATLFCLKRLWADEEVMNQLAEFFVDDTARKLCSTHWVAVESRNICYRSLIAVKQLTEIFGDYTETSYPGFDTPDLTRVDHTTILYPRSIQCRMDTFLAGALCGVEWNPNVIPGRLEQLGLRSLKAEEHAAQFSCPTSGGGVQSLAIGGRPRCWYYSRL